MERAIRTALEKGDAEDAAFRERVYGQALAALERAAAANRNLTLEAVLQRRADLKRKIALIESEFAPALGGVSREAQAGSRAPDIHLGDPLHTGRQHEPRLDVTPDDAEPRSVSFDAPDLGSGHAPVAPRRHRRRMARWLVIVTVLAALLIGVWWVYRTGLLGAFDDGSVPNPPQILRDEDYDPPADGGASQAPRPIQEADADTQWIEIFDPADPTTVRTPSGASAEILQEGNAGFMRIRSGSPGAALSFEVGQGVLEQIAGRKAIFSLVARAEGAAPTQISVECDLGGLGNCGRRRYDVGTERAEYLFDVELPRVAPRGEGTISIVTQLTGEPRAVDVFQLRVSIAE